MKTEIYDGMCEWENTEVVTKTVNTQEPTKTDKEQESIILEKEKPVIWEDYSLENDFWYCNIIRDINNEEYVYNRSWMFIDESSSIHKDTILKFAKIGIVDGYSDGSFQPNLYITRSEFLKIALISHCYEYKNQDPNSLGYTDIDMDSWQAKVVQKAQSLWMINGDIDESWNSVFRPNDIISKAEAIKILMRLSLIESSTLRDLGYKDVTTSWHAKYIMNGESLWLFSAQRDNYIFNPNSGVSREDMVDLISRLVNLYN